MSADPDSPPDGTLVADDRVGLRPVRVDDAEAHLVGCDELIIERLGGGEPSTRAQVAKWRGYATRAVRLAMSVALERQPVVEFVIRTAPDNPESLAVAERAGFTRSHVTSDQHGELVWLSFRPGQRDPRG